MNEVTRPIGVLSHQPRGVIVATVDRRRRCTPDGGDATDTTFIDASSDREMNEHRRPARAMQSLGRQMGRAKRCHRQPLRQRMVETQLREQQRHIGHHHRQRDTRRTILFIRRLSWRLRRNGWALNCVLVSMAMRAAMLAMMRLPRITCSRCCHRSMLPRQMQLHRQSADVGQHRDEKQQCHGKTIGHTIVMILGYQYQSMGMQ